MSAIDATMLASMQAAIAELLPDTCNVTTITNTPDGEGGVTQAKGTTYTALACRLDTKMSRQQVAGGAIEPYMRTMLSLPHDTVITSANQIEHNGLTYAIVGPPNTDQSWLAVVRVELERIF